MAVIVGKFRFSNSNSKQENQKVDICAEINGCNTSGWITIYHICKVFPR